MVLHGWLRGRAPLAPPPDSQHTAPGAATSRRPINRPGPGRGEGGKQDRGKWGCGRESGGASIKHTYLHFTASPKILLSLGKVACAEVVGFWKVLLQMRGMVREILLVGRRDRLWTCLWAKADNALRQTIRQCISGERDLIVTVRREPARVTRAGRLATCVCSRRRRLGGAAGRLGVGVVVE